MTIRQIYQLAIDMGIKADPRGTRGVDHWLLKQKKKYQRLSKDERLFFDRENLTNPYADTRLHYGDPATSVKTVLAGIDAEEAEIALAKALEAYPSSESHRVEKFSTSSNKIDLVIAHHPVGRALATLNDVMYMQAEIMAAAGVPINIAEDVMRERIEEVSRGLSPQNHMRAIDAARLAHLPYMNIHTPADNLVYQFLDRMFQRKKPETVGEIIELLQKIPEYKIATLHGAGPKIFVGSPDRQAGRIAVTDVTGGTSGSKEIYPALAAAGVGTVIGMHMKEENRAEALKHHLNVIIAGHMSSDSLGLNLFLDRLAEKKIKIIPCGGLIRVRRNSKHEIRSTKQ